MTFSDQYIKTLEKVYELTKTGQTKEIETDYSIPKMFGAWSSIFWALPQLERFNEFSFDELKKLVQALIKSHCAYGLTTNQYLRTDTVDWIVGKLKISAKIYGNDPNEELYVISWVNELYNKPDTEYFYNSLIGEKLKAENDIKNEIAKKAESEKIERLNKIEQENEIRYAEKRKIFFEHLERNSAQKIKREEYLSLFSSLSLLDKLRKVISEDKPLFFFPTDFSDVDQETLSELTKDERVSLYKKILKYRMKEWYNTIEKMEELDEKIKYHR